MLVAQAGKTVAEVDIACPRQARQVPSPQLSRSVWIWAVGWLDVVPTATVQGQGGEVKWQSWKGHHFRDQASCPLTSFLVAFVLPDSRVGVIAFCTELW